MITKWFHFLGGVYFALILLSIAALIVIAGTFLEASTSSHAYAAQFTYGHPLFSLLICGFFINILFAALRRWPFQWRHIPFLITHLGLLMLLAGVLVKNWMGIQGSMTLVEGSGSHQITLADQAVVHLESREAQPIDWLLVHPFIGKPYLKTDHHISCLRYLPHAQERIQLWTKGDWLSIAGLAPIPLTHWSVGTPLSRNDKIIVHPWTLQAFQTDDVQALVMEVYLQDLELLIKERASGRLLLQEPLYPRNLGIDFVAASLNLPISVEHGFVKPEVLLKFPISRSPWDSLSMEELCIPLDGPRAAENENLQTPLLGDLPIIAQLQRPPTIVFVRDGHGDEFLITFNAQGAVSCQIFRPAALDSVYVIDEGYGGYALQAQLPSDEINIQEREEKRLKQLEQALRMGISQGEPLAPPLILLSKACEKAHLDFPSTCTEFLSDWNAAHCWLYPPLQPLKLQAARAMAHLDWSLAPEGTRNSCQWAFALTESLEEQIRQGTNLAQYLIDGGWPLSLPVEAHSDSVHALNAVHQQLFQLAGQLPECPETHSTEASLFSAYLRVYGLHLSQLMDWEDSLESTGSGYLRCYITATYEENVPTQKIEEMTPVIELQIDSTTPPVSLKYDRSGTGLKWPIGGRFLARFQPLQTDIPYHVRLRDARKIRYPNSTQAFSYEADVIVTDRRNGHAIETTLSMNRVHETLDGYRFYLSSLAPGDESTVRQVQLAVNRDPAKYFLTYAGGIVLTLGIILLFFSRKSSHPLC